MTLLDLLNKVNNSGSQFNTLSIPLMKDGHPVEFDLQIGGLLRGRLSRKHNQLSRR